MNSDTDIVVGQGKASIERSRARRTNVAPINRSIGKKSRAYKVRHLGQKLLRIVLWWIALLVGSTAFSLIVGPLEVTGIIIVAMLALLGTLMLAAYPRIAGVSDHNLLETDIASLPAKTEIWLEAQRPSLPAPAQHVIDRIGPELDVLSAQLQALDPREPATDEVRRLIGEHLPGLVNGYKRVPQAMRGRATVAGGRSADQELVEGLTVIEREIKGMSENIARGDLDALATRGRYLEMKYQDGHGG